MDSAPPRSKSLLAQASLLAGLVGAFLLLGGLFNSVSAQCTGYWACGIWTGAYRCSISGVGCSGPTASCGSTGGTCQWNPQSHCTPLDAGSGGGGFACSAFSCSPNLQAAGCPTGSQYCVADSTCQWSGPTPTPGGPTPTSPPTGTDRWRIRGRVEYYNDMNLSGATVTVTYSDGTTSTYITNAQGVFSFNRQRSAVPNGNYTVTATKAGHRTFEAKGTIGQPGNCTKIDNNTTWRCDKSRGNINVEPEILHNFEEIPPSCSSVNTPSGLSATYNGNNTSTFSWGAVSNSNTPVTYDLRINLTANGWNGSCSSPNAGDTCTNAYNGGTEFTRNTDPGNCYNWWIHARNACGNVSPATSQHSFCVPSTPSTPSCSGPAASASRNCSTNGNPLISVSWQGIRSCTWYEVSYGNTTAATGNTATHQHWGRATAQQTKSFSGLNRNQPWYFKVKCTNVSSTPACNPTGTWGSAGSVSACSGDQTCTTSLAPNPMNVSVDSDQTMTLTVDGPSNYTAIWSKNWATAFNMNGTARNTRTIAGVGTGSGVVTANVTAAGWDCPLASATVNVSSVACSGSRPIHSTICPGDGAQSGNWSRVSGFGNCSAAVCQYYCNTGYTGSNCVLAPTSTPTPTPTPIIRNCNQSCNGANQQCAVGLSCMSGVCRNPSCSGRSDCTCSQPTCGLSLTPISNSIDVGETVNLAAVVVPNPSGTSVSNVVFSRESGSSVTPSNNLTDNSSPYSRTYTGSSAGTSTIRATATLATGRTCFGESTINVSNPDTPTPTTRNCNQSCNGANQQCALGLSCISGVCRNSSCSGQTDCTCSQPTCGIALVPGSNSIDVGDDTSVSAVVTVNGSASVNNVVFSRSGNFVTPASRTDSTVPFSASFTGSSTGSSTINATATLSTGGTCTTTAAGTGATISVGSAPVPTSTPVPLPCTCSVNSINPSGSIDIGQSRTYTANVTSSNCSISRVDFSVNNSNASISPTSDTTSNYQTVLTGQSSGGVTLSATAVTNTGVTCGRSRNITVNQPDSCNVNLVPTSATMNIGDTNGFTAVLTNVVGTVDEVRFNSFNSSIANVLQSVDTSLPYSTQVRGGVPGTTQVGVSVIMGGVEVCSDSTPSSVTVEPPSCNFNLTPASLEVNKLESRPLVVSNVTSNGPIQRVEFRNSNSSIANVNPTSDTSVVYQTSVTGTEIGGPATITADMYMYDSVVCSDTAQVTIVNPDPWWQATSGNIQARGDVASKITGGCVLIGGCQPHIITGTGLLANSGSLATGSGSVSPSEWRARADYSSTTSYGFDYFNSRISSIVPKTTLGTSAGNADFQSGTQHEGYYWYYYNGANHSGSPLTLSGSNINVGSRKVVLIVENADLIINTSIGVDDGRGTFIVFADRDIDVSSSVGSVNGSAPDIEGVFVSNGEFATGTVGSDNDSILYVRGVVAANAGINLQRNLPDNSQRPAEIFEHGIDQMFLFPNGLSAKRIQWKEVAP